MTRRRRLSYAAFQELCFVMERNIDDIKEIPGVSGAYSWMRSPLNILLTDRNIGLPPEDRAAVESWAKKYKEDRDAAIAGQKRASA